MSWFPTVLFIDFFLGDPAVLVRGAGVLEPTDQDQQQFPLHQLEADPGVWPRRLCEILHPHTAQVEKAPIHTYYSKFHY